MSTPSHQYEDKILEFAYGELPPHEASAVDAHVQHCDKCAQALRKIRSVRAVMADVPFEDAPEAGLDSLLAYAQQAAQRQAKQRGGFGKNWIRFLAPLTSMLAIGIALGVLFQLTPADKTAPVVSGVPAKEAALESPQPEGATASDDMVAMAVEPMPPPAEKLSAFDAEKALAKSEPVTKGKAKDEFDQAFGGVGTRGRSEGKSETASLEAPQKKASRSVGSSGAAAESQAGVARAPSVAKPATQPTSQAAPVKLAVESKQASTLADGLAGLDKESQLERWAAELAQDPSDAKRLGLLDKLCVGYSDAGLFQKAAPFCRELIVRYPTSDAAQRAARRSATPPLEVPAASERGF